ncbi:YggT family protein [Labrys miyagiensis]
MRPLLEIVIYLLQAYVFVILAAIVLNWLVAFNIVNRRNPAVASIGDVLYRLTEPVLAPIRRRLPDFGALDLSPFVVILLIYFIQRVIALYIYPNVF